MEKPTELRKAVIREDIGMGLHSQNRRFRNGVRHHRIMTGRPTVYPLIFPDQKI